jgi:hypothetical protein
MDVGTSSNSNLSIGLAVLVGSWIIGGLLSWFSFWLSASICVTLGALAASERGYRVWRLTKATPLRLGAAVTLLALIWVPPCLFAFRFGVPQTTGHGF